jgi:hypothetical protein
LQARYALESPARGSTNSFYDFEHRGTKPGAKVKYVRSTSSHKHLCCKNMRARKITDVDVVAGSLNRRGCQTLYR